MRRKETDFPPKSMPEKIMDAFELPKISSGIVTAVHITGIREAVVEGHKGIIEYTDKCIKFNAPQFVIKLSGAELEITGVAEEYITVKGIITGVEYLF